jgi:hypothetical protein
LLNKERSLKNYFFTYKKMFCEQKIKDFPDEILITILEYLSPTEALALYDTCKKWCKVVISDGFRTIKQYTKNVSRLVRICQPPPKAYRNSLRFICSGCPSEWTHLPSDRNKPELSATYLLGKKRMASLNRIVKKSYSGRESGKD